MEDIEEEGEEGEGEGEGEKQISPDDKLKILLESELFKINNFTRIFEILHRVPAAPAAPIPAAPAPAKPAPAKPAAPVATQQDNILFTIEKDKLIINGGNLQKETVDDYFTDIKDSLIQTTYDEIKSNIICSNIIEAINNTTVILDPANFDSIISNLTGHYLSGLIYELINPNEKTHTSPLTNASNVKYLFTSTYKNAFYKTYNINKTIAESKKINAIKLNIIHSVGPNFTANNNIKFKNTYLNYKTFNKIYSDIYNAYIDITDHNITNLLLVCISSGIFATNDNIDYSTEVLTLIAAKFIKLFIINKNNNLNKNIKMYIYNPNFTDNMCKYYDIFLYQVKRIFRLITTTIT